MGSTLTKIRSRSENRKRSRIQSPLAYQQKINEEATIIFLGDYGVGKTSIVERYLDDSFHDISFSSMSQEFHDKYMVLKDEQCIKLNIRVSQGANSYLKVTKEFITKANVVIGVYEVDCKSSLDACKKLVKQFLYRKRDCLVFMVGNKTDLYRSDNRNVKCEAAREYAMNHAFLWMEVSAKTGENIPELFERVTDEICSIRSRTD